MTTSALSRLARASVVATPAILAFGTSPLKADTHCPLESKLTASDDAAFDWFGYSVALAADVAVIGSYLDDDVFNSSGSAYVYRFEPRTQQWVEEAKLNASEPQAFDYFGRAVAISGDLIAIGALFDDGGCRDGFACNSGAAYVFRFDPGAKTWEEEAKLTASDAAAYDDFGSAVSVDGDVALIGASNDDVTALDSGSAYVFRFNGGKWQEEAKLVPADDDSDLDHFGWSVAIRGDVAVIGSPGDEDGGSYSTDAGSVYLFRRDCVSQVWTEEANVLASTAAAYDAFGTAVAISQEWVLIGAPGDDTLGLAAGAAYVFTFNGDTWTETAKLFASDAAGGDSFGQSVSLGGDVAVVGAPGHDDAGGNSGSAYVFRLDGAGTWTELLKLTASDAAASDQFGTSVSLSGDAALIGAMFDDDACGDSGFCSSGSAYVFEGVSSDCNDNGILDACDLAEGTSLDADANGIPDECQPALCDADVNADQNVDPLDMAWVTVRLGCIVGAGDLECDAADVSADGKVDPLDIGLVQYNLGPCP